MKILIINGPNLNWLGQREPEIYGTVTMESYLKKLRECYTEHDIQYAQSNIEGVLIDLMQVANMDGVEGIILNAGAYTHTSLALADCIRAMSIPVVEVHISNTAKREAERHVSKIASACMGSITGFGMDSYRLALEALTANS